MLGYDCCCLADGLCFFALLMFHHFNFKPRRFTGVDINNSSLISSSSEVAKEEIVFLQNSHMTSSYDRSNSFNAAPHFQVHVEKQEEQGEEKQNKHGIFDHL